MRRLIAIGAFLGMAQAFAAEDQTPPPGELKRVPKIMLCGRFQGVEPVCPRTCAQWAGWQPDFKTSYEACLAKCYREMPCTE